MDEIPAAFGEWLRLDVPKANVASAWKYRSNRPGQHEFWRRVQAGQDAAAASAARNARKLAIALDALRDIRDTYESDEHGPSGQGEAARALDRIAALGPSLGDLLGDDPAPAGAGEASDHIGTICANAPEDGDSFGLLEELAMRIAAFGIVDEPRDGRHPDGCACQFCREDEREERAREELDDDTDSTIPDTEGGNW